MKKIPARKQKSLDTRTALTISGGAALTLGIALSPGLEAATFNVTNLNDSGAGSLRQAIVDANGAAGADVVAFQAGLTGTITLTTGQLYITDSLDIQGPGPANLTVSGNNASRVFYLYNGSTVIDVTISGLTITGGNASIGAGVVDFDENLTLDDVVITGNSATGDGGGLWADAIDDMNLTVMNSSITNNTAGDDGGGIYIEDTGGPLLIQNTTITGNDAAGSGGGIYFYDPDDDVTVENSTISGNSAGGVGGGIYLYSPDRGNWIIRQTTISGNTAEAGGGIFLHDPDQPLSIESSTISGNQATAGPGGGIFLYNLYTGGQGARTANAVFTGVGVHNSTISGNSAVGTGGGIYLYSGTLAIDNSILANSTGGIDDLGGDNFDVSFSLVETPGTASINDIAGNIFSQDPQLGALANNGGPTQTHLPAALSPAVNAGDPAFVPPPAVDQRGLPRIAAGTLDMGAVEVNPGVVQFTVTAVAVNEADITLTLTVTRTGGTDGAISVNFASANGVAVAPDDFGAVAGTLNWANGDGVSKTFDITLVNDTVAEPAETFTVALSNPVGTTIGANSDVTVTINASAGPPSQLGFVLMAVSVDESAGTVTLAVQRTGSSSGAISVDYLAVAGTALLPDDFSSAAGTLNWADGDTADKFIQVTLAQDGLTEPDETFTVVLSNPANATLGNNTVATVTINANSGPSGVEVPSLGWWARLMLMLGTAFAGLWALGRRMLGVALVSLLAAGFAFDASATPPTPKGKSAKATQIKSVSSPSASTVSIELADGSVVTVDSDKLEVSDHRAKSKGKGHGKANSLEAIAADQPAVVKVRTDRSGDVKHVRVKLYDSAEKANADLETKN